LGLRLSLGTMMAMPAKMMVQKKRDTVYDLMALRLVGLLKTKRAKAEKKKVAIKKRMEATFNLVSSCNSFTVYKLAALNP
jgi:hypothetical protein